MSAVLQALTHTPPLYRGLLDSKHICAVDDKGNVAFCILCAFQSHFRKALDPSRRIVEPLELLSNLNSFMPKFEKGEHQDPHDFLLCALAKLKESLPPEENLIDQIFGSTLVTRVRCLTCFRSPANAFVPEINRLGLNITDTNEIELALASFFRTEIVVRKCPFCKRNEPTEKQHVFSEVPLVATIQLLRFDENGNKITKHVRFSKDLVLQSRNFGTGGDNTLWNYDLYAIVEHRGPVIGGGHCVSYICSASGEWNLMNDTEVTLVSEAEVLTAEAYILFYLRKGKLPAPTKLTTTSEEPTNTCLAIVPYKAVYDEPAKQAKDKTAASETRDMDEMERQKKPEKSEQTKEETINKTHEDTQIPKSSDVKDMDAMERQKKPEKSEQTKEETLNKTHEDTQIPKSSDVKDMDAMERQKKPEQTKEETINKTHEDTPIPKSSDVEVPPLGKKKSRKPKWFFRFNKSKKS